MSLTNKLFLFIGVVAVVSVVVQQYRKKAFEAESDNLQLWLENFVAYQNAIFVCSGSVVSEPDSGSIARVKWEQYASIDSIEKVVAFYKGLYPNANVQIDENHGFALKSIDGQLDLSIEPVGGNYPRCEQDIPLQAKSVLTVSRMIKINSKEK